jgi:uncharacterized membrane protein (Fun14 family)
VIWYVSPLPWLLPGSVLALVAATLGSAVVGRWLGVRRIVAWTLLVTLGIIASGTLTPLDREFQGSAHPGTCDLSRLGPAALADLTDPTTDVAANILLFIPLGLTVGLIPGSRRKAAIVVGALVLPVMIESVQLLATPLHRGCESADVIDNLTGLAIGLVVGTALRRYVPSVRREVEPVD